jgi:hypothetical protein
MNQVLEKKYINKQKLDALLNSLFTNEYFVEVCINSMVP